MTIAGKISVALRPNAEVEIRSSRPLQLTASLRGRAAADVAQRIPALYALCGRAQCQAAQLAMQSAGALATSETRSGERAAAIEAALESIWRFAIDLPQWADLSLQMAPFARLRRTLIQADCADPGRLLNHYVAEHLLGVEPSVWAAWDTEALLCWLFRSEAPAAELLRLAESVLVAAGNNSPPPTALLTDPGDERLREIANAMKVEAYLATPRWRDDCVETGARAYQQHHRWFQSEAVGALPAALQRLLARLLELVSIGRYLNGATDQPALSGGVSLAEGEGLGWVRTARGLLIHSVRANGTRIDDYRILAPTEWNFHPRGVLATELAAWMGVAPELRQRWLGLQVMSLDPCVAYELEVYDA